MAEEHELIVGRSGRRLQKVTIRRKIFTEKRQEAFLAALAASCNVRAAAKAAEVAVPTVYLRRRKCAVFRAAWQEALEEGYSRLEAALLKKAIAAVERPRPAAKGQEPAIGAMDAASAIHLLREHKRGLAGIPHKGRLPGRASVDEACARLEKKLKALGVRIAAEG